MVTSRAEPRGTVVAVSLAIAMLLSSAPIAPARELDIEARVESQRAIEQVSWSHRIWPAESPEPKPPLAGPVIDFQPTPQATILGGRAIFTVIAGGGSPLSYQWRKDGVNLSDGAAIGGSTTDVLTLSGVTAADAASLSVVVSNASGTVTSVDAALSVTTPQGGDVDFSFDPGSSINGFVYAVARQSDGRVLVGGNFTTVNGVSRSRIARMNSNGSLDTSFLNGLAGANASVSSLAVQSNGRVLIGGSFSAVNGVSRSYVARLYGSAPVAPAVSSQPAAQDSYAGSCAVFNVTATGTPRDHRWRKDGVDLFDGGAIRGAATDMLTITGLSAADEGDYNVVVSNVLGSETSLGAALTVASVPQCKVATCDPVLGAVLVDAIDGASCDDGNACTTSDTCTSGSCTGGTGALPVEVASVSVSKSGPTIVFGWSANSGASGYDMLRGKVRNWPVGSNPATETCLSGNVVGSTATDGTVPTAGDGYWYLFRAENACGNGSYGSQASSGVTTLQRLSETCP